ncbi:MAG TPA: hypothetical protein GX701_02885 [Clostridiales bacterium]|jgi:cell division protein FtsB|nr:hypothetical protein [Clostridiales bacterium]
MAKKAAIPRRRPRLIIKVVLVVLALYIVGTYISLQTQLQEARTLHAELKHAQALEQQKTQQLREEVESELDHSYIAKVAREKLGYVMPGERVYIDANGR